MLEDLGETIQNVGLAQSIQNGLPNSQSAAPRWPDPDTLAAKRAVLKEAKPWDEFQQPLCRYIMEVWAVNSKCSLANAEERRTTEVSSTIRPNAPASSVHACLEAPTKLGVMARWAAFCDSPEFGVLAKYKCLEDTTLAEPTTDATFHDMRPLGKGAFGVVSLVFKKDTGCAFATKKVNKLIAKEKRMLQDVLVEHRVLLQLRSNFCVSLHYAWQDKESLAMVLTLCPGGDLSFLLKNRYANPEAKDKRSRGRFNALPDGAVRFYAASIALGLAAIHGVGFVYRDLKPQNVLLDAEGRVRISDMGLAADVSRGPISGKSGTRGYWSPEQIRREPYTTLPDWWSLGVTMYVLHSDRQPFYAPSGLDGDAKAAAIDEATCSQDIEFKHEEPAELQAVIRALCERDTGRRLGRAGGVAELRTHPYFAAFDWGRLEQGTMEAPLLPSLNEINAPSAKDIEEFKPPQGLTWDAEEVALFEHWSFTSRWLWQQEAVERVKRKKEVSREEAEVVAKKGCCVVQ